MLNPFPFPFPFQQLDVYVFARELARSVHAAGIGDRELRDHGGQDAQGATHGEARALAAPSRRRHPITCGMST